MSRGRDCRGGTAVAATPARDRRKAKAAAAWRRRGLVLLFLSPWLIGFTIFIAIPLLVTFGLSFTRYDLLGDPTWIGLSNYERLLLDRPPDLAGDRQHAVVRGRGGPVARRCSRSASRSCSPAPAAVSGIYRTVFYLPALAPPVAATLGFVYLLNPATGPVNTLLRPGRHRGPALVPVARLVEDLARDPGRLGPRQRDDHLPRGGPRRAAAPPRVGRARRRRRAGSASAR